jgi:hypothetical protein
MDVASEWSLNRDAWLPGISRYSVSVNSAGQRIPDCLRERERPPLPQQSSGYGPWLRDQDP